MKLIMAIVTDQAADNITDALLAAGFRATRLASTGGFRRREIQPCSWVWTMRMSSPCWPLSAAEPPPRPNANPPCRCLPPSRARAPDVAPSLFCPYRDTSSSDMPARRLHQHVGIQEQGTQVSPLLCHYWRNCYLPDLRPSRLLTTMPSPGLRK